MKTFPHPQTRHVSPLLASMVLMSSLALTGCSTLNDSLSGSKVDYKSAQTKAPSLEVPPDLSQLTRDSRYVVPGTTVTASAYQAGQAAPAAQVPTAAATVGDVRIERAGSQRWLVVNRPVDKLWQPVTEFWKESGFQLNIEKPDLGIMETEFAENRAKLPQDLIRSTLGRVLDGLYSTGERDKFRTRLERGSNGTTEIFISHRGMVEVLTGPSSGTLTSSTIWQPRATDPELEAEFLGRLMVKLGVSQDQSKALLATNTARPTSRIETVDDAPALQVEEGFDRAWRRVGLALDRTGFTVEDRDRNKGLYFVRYVTLGADAKPTGFFSNLFGGAAATPALLKYQLALRSRNEQTTVTVLNAEGKPESSVNAQRILKVLADDLK